MARAHCCVLSPSLEAAESIDGEVFDTDVIFSYLVVEKFIATASENSTHGRPPPYVIANLSTSRLQLDISIPTHNICVTLAISVWFELQLRCQTCVF